MKLSASWLRGYLEKKVSLQDIEALIERAGIEIEQVDYTNHIDTKIIVVQITSIKPHPNADKLVVTEVTDGKTKYQVVTGAPNVAKGQKVPLARVGSKLPDGRTITAAKIRGLDSKGMLCSAQELSLGSDHAGILILSEQAKPGTTIADYLGPDMILDLKTHPNRPDLNSVIGVAREVAAQAGTSAKEPELATLTLNEPGQIEIVAKDRVSRYLGAWIEIPPPWPATPTWMVDRLNEAGIRSVNLVVDVTNFVMLEQGQPLHAFDAAKIHGRVRIRQAESGEKVITLDESLRELVTSDLVIADRRGPIALAGVMGGADSEVGDETARILLESATFDGPSVRKTALRLGLRTEASARFERALPVQLAAVGLARAIQLLSDLTKVKVEHTEDHLQVWPWVQRVGLRADFLNQVLALKLKPAEVIKHLQALGFEAEEFKVDREAAKHLGKPYIWGASFKKNGDEAFDCSYLVDFVYSKIGLDVGHTALAQYDIGTAVPEDQMQPGDVVFYEGVRRDGVKGYDLSEIQSANSSAQPTSGVGHYFMKDPASGRYQKIKAKYQGLVGHNGIYVGRGQVIMAAQYEWKDNKWAQMARPGVVKVPLEYFTNRSDYLGARRFASDLGGYISVVVPWWRPDVKTPEDLAEEVVKLVGFDKVPASLPPYAPKQLATDQIWPQLFHLKEVLRGAGLFEVLTYSFVSEQDLIKTGLDPKHHLKLQNPRSVEQSYLRSTLLPSLLKTVASNNRYAKEFGIFELSRVFTPTRKGKLPREQQQLGVIYRSDQNAYVSVKAVLDLMAEVWGVKPLLKTAVGENLYPGRAANLFVDERKIGTIAEVHPGLLSSYKINGAAAYLELNWSAWLEVARPKQFQILSKFPAATRDLAVVVARRVTWQEVAAAITHSKLARASFIGDYYGEELAGKKSLAMSLEMIAIDHTLTDAEVEERLQQIVKLLKRQFAASVR